LKVIEVAESKPLYPDLACKYFLLDLQGNGFAVAVLWGDEKMNVTDRVQ